MKRTFLVFAALLLVLAGASALQADSSTTLTVKPSEMRDGETKTVTDDGRTITVRREGDRTRVEIEGADQTETLTITREGGRIVIGRDGVDGLRSILVGPDRRRIVIDGMPLPDLEHMPRFRSMPGAKMHTYFVCPKDRSTLRVPEENSGQTYRCPVDGTTMEKRRGRGFTLLFDDETIEL